MKNQTKLGEKLAHVQKLPDTLWKDRELRFFMGKEQFRDSYEGARLAYKICKRVVSKLTDADSLEYLVRVINGHEAESDKRKQALSRTDYANQSFRSGVWCFFYDFRTEVAKLYDCEWHFRLHHNYRKG